MFLVFISLSDWTFPSVSFCIVTVLHSCQSTVYHPPTVILLYLRLPFFSFLLPLSSLSFVCPFLPVYVYVYVSFSLSLFLPHLHYYLCSHTMLQLYSTHTASYVISPFHPLFHVLISSLHSLASASTLLTATRHHICLSSQFGTVLEPLPSPLRPLSVMLYPYHHPTSSLRPSHINAG